MKAFELHPEDGFDALKLVDRAPYRTRRRARPRASGIVELSRPDGRSGSKKRARRIVPASDGAGEVIEIGSGVKRLAAGDRVAAAFFPTWIDGPFAEEHHASALGDRSMACSPKKSCCPNGPG